MTIAKLKKISIIIGLIVLLVVVLGGTIFLGKNASTYFARASSCPSQNVAAAQVTANTAVVTWETSEVSQGRVLYGTNATNLTVKTAEDAAGKTHNVPLTLLTPNTVYYYLIAIGDTNCDTSGQSCTLESCVPWSFTTQPIAVQQEVVAPIATATPTVPPNLIPIASVSATIPPISQSTSTSSSTLSKFCTQVQLNIGKSSQDATKWATFKQYDVDSNGVINGLDLVKCGKLGK